MRTREARFTHLSAVLMLTITTIVPAGCGGNGSGAPPEASSPASAVAKVDNGATHDVSGEFVGTINDSVFGTGQAAAELSQYQQAAGGVLTFTYGSTAFITPASFIENGRKLTGTSNFSISGSSGICAFSETATYKNGSLKGSYQAVNGCSGDRGTYTMTQKCRFSRRFGAGVNFALKSC